MNPQKLSCLERQLGLKFSSDFKSRVYIQVIAADAEGMVCSSYRPRKYLNPHAMYLEESDQTRNGVLLLYLGCCRPTPTIHP